MSTIASLPADEQERRGQLADFLRTRRARVQPGDVGLPSGSRRRTPGLRREEIASLAGVSVTWYTWLEQARDVQPSAQVLDALSRALRLDDAERSHLFVLGRTEAPPPPATDETASAAIQRLIDNLGPNPAYVIGRRWDYLAWNRAAVAVFGDYAVLPAGRRNSLWNIFTDPARRRLLVGWEGIAQHAMAQFRAASARHIGDPSFTELIDALQQASPEFRRWWPRHDVVGSPEGRKEIDHPDARLLAFEHATFQLTVAPEQRLVLYTPLPEHDTPSKLEHLLTTQARTSKDAGQAGSNGDATATLAHAR